MSNTQKKRTGPMVTLQPFLVGGLSGMGATSCIQPIDYIKVQIQLSSKGTSFGSVLSGVVAEKGAVGAVRHMYTGLSAALLRQATYTTTRLGVFKTLSDMLTEPGKKIGVVQSSIASIAAGGIGAIVGNPADLALIRMQADTKLPVDQKRNYTGVVNALTRIAREEGIMAWWTGCGPTVARACALNFGMLAPYDQIRMLAEGYFGKGEKANTCGKLAGAFLGSAFSLPLDYAKTYLQKQKPDAQGNLQYRGLFDCVIKVAKTEGPLTLYKGFGTYLIRIGPHIFLTLTFQEQLNALMSKHYWRDAK